MKFSLFCEETCQIWLSQSDDTFRIHYLGSALESMPWLHHKLPHRACHYDTVPHMSCSWFGCHCYRSLSNPSTMSRGSIFHQLQTNIFCIIIAFKKWCGYLMQFVIGVHQWFLIIVFYDNCQNFLISCLYFIPPGNNFSGKWYP